MRINNFRYLTFLLMLPLVSCSRHPAPAPEPKKVEKVEKRVQISLPVAPVEKSAPEIIVHPFPVEKEVDTIEAIRRGRVKQRFYVPSHENKPIVQPSQETVEIGGTTYVIPSPWVGKKQSESGSVHRSLVKLPAEYVYGKREVFVKKEVRAPLLAMIDAAATEGISLLVETAYRDVETQKEIFIRKFREGRTWNDVVRYVAPPGYSEHMLGLAIDFYPSGWRFASTKGYHWLKSHGGEYGFIESYPKQPLAGHASIAWEAWHWLYIHGEKNPVAVESDLPSVSVDGVAPEKEIEATIVLPESSSK